MTIDSIVQLAYGHFIAQNYTGHQIRSFIKDHAMDELNLSEENARALAWKEASSIEDKEDVTAYRDFYLWYYLNHIAPPDVDMPDSDHSVFMSKAPNGLRDITVYAIIQVTARVDELLVDEAIHEWESNCNYELASSDRLIVLNTEFIGTARTAPLI